MSLDQVKRLMGTKIGGKSGVPVKDYPDAQFQTIPTSFNCRDKWTKCASTFDYIKDQAGCGSCWV